MQVNSDHLSEVPASARERCHSSLTVRICAGAGHAMVNASNGRPFASSEAFTGIHDIRCHFTGVWHSKTAIASLKTDISVGQLVSCDWVSHITCDAYSKQWSTAWTNHRLTSERQMPVSDAMHKEWAKRVSIVSHESNPSEEYRRQKSVIIRRIGLWDGSSHSFSRHPLRIIHLA